MNAQDVASIIQSRVDRFEDWMARPDVTVTEYLRGQVFAYEQTLNLLNAVIRHEKEAAS